MKRLMILSLSLSLLACSADDSGSMGAETQAEPGVGGSGAPPESSGVGQIGAQDFGRFRQLLEAGQIPGPDTLDAPGFFAEHKLDYPAADCGENICLHGLLGISYDFFRGEPLHLVQIGMNSPLKPAEMERPPLDLVLAIDTSGSMQGEAISAVKEGLRRMLPELGSEDRLSIVGYSNQAKLLLENVGSDQEGLLIAAIEMLNANGATNIYDGLFSAFSLASELKSEDRETRVLLLSDGVATAGFLEPQRIQSLARAYIAEGIGLTTIGVGKEFDLELMRGLSELGAGNFYFLESPSAVKEVFIEELQTFLLPIALQARLELRVGGGYQVRGAHGVHNWTGGIRSGYAEMPALFLAGRQRSDEPPREGSGRRGGGGGILVEIQGLEESSSEAMAQLSLSWIDPESGEAQSQELQVENSYNPTEVPDGGHFSSETVAKGFMMFNLYLAFRSASQLATAGDTGAAVALLENVKQLSEVWLIDRPDSDLEDDLHYVELFLENLYKHPIQTPEILPRRPQGF